MHADAFLRDVIAICDQLDGGEIEEMVDQLVKLRERGGRLFLLGLGGSAANCSHAACDFRKLCEIRASVPTDNMAEFSARANDEGWDSVFVGWLRASHASSKDAIFVMSVGGGTDEVSTPITRALRYAAVVGMQVFGIVGPKGGATADLGTCVIKIPAGANVTPHTEAFQAVLWHCLVSHPALQRAPTKW